MRTRFKEHMNRHGDPRDKEFIRRLRVWHEQHDEAIRKHVCGCQAKRGLDDNGLHTASCEIGDVLTELFGRDNT